MRSINIVIISDTHGRHDALSIPDGDILIHAGDFTGRGRPEEVSAFNAFLAKLPHRHKIVIAGNHDFLFEGEPALACSLLTDCIYLEDEGITDLSGYAVNPDAPLAPDFFVEPR